MPPYHTPPEALARSSSNSPPLSRSKSYSQSDSTKSNHTSRAKTSKHGDREEGHSHKIPYIFLGSIAAASLLAHKYWPRGFLHGEKEPWELSEYARRAKERHEEKRAASRSASLRRGCDRPYGAYDDCTPRHHERDPSRCSSRFRDDGDAFRGREVKGKDGRMAYSRQAEPAFHRGRSRGRSHDRYAGIITAATTATTTAAGSNSSSGGSSPYQRTTAVSRERRSDQRYYPSAPQRYPTETSVSAARSGSSATVATPGYVLGRSLPTAGPRRSYYREGSSPEVVYVYRDAPARPRRASFDTDAGADRGGMRWGERDYDGYSR
ncbi:hypothetical protein MMYC01_201069 [Madurella mycetomatis]|uniref:Uncharacterized protein n=1 Tax=Madurella mycetomatis TaxID=100816 RepID=A0A175WGM0_9PEZI|nr:hypothetical protein MMYC01_201069 [Madurella mycetomatis]